MASWADYTFRINKLHANFKRSDIDHVDNDYLWFSVGRGNDLFVAPACQPGKSGSIGNVESGNDVPIFDLPTGGENKDWAIGPITIHDEDSVIVTFVVNNLSDSDPPTQIEQQLQTSGALVSAIGGGIAVGGLLSGPGETAAAAAGAIVAAIGGVMQALGALFHWIGLGGQTNCNGPVLISPEIPFTGSQLQQLDYSAVPNQPSNVVGVHNFSNHHLAQNSQAGCGHPPDTDVFWSVVRDFTRVDTFGSGPPPPPLPLQALAASLSQQDWNGIWGDAFFVEDSRIVCFISSDGGGVALGAPSTPPPSERIGAHMQVLQQKLTTVPTALSLIGTDPRTARTGPLTLPSTSALGAIPSHKAQVTEHFGSPSGRVAATLQIDRIIEITMLATPFIKDVYPPTPPSGVVITPPPIAVESSQSPPAGSISRATMAPTIAQVTSDTSGGGVVSVAPASQAGGGTRSMPPGGFHGFVAAEPTLLAATLVVSDEICLQLYGGFDPTGRIVNHRVRYLRTTKAGGTVTDVMLAPAQRKPT
jgi:hypothetical protein